MPILLGYSDAARRRYRSLSTPRHLSTAKGRWLRLTLFTQHASSMFSETPSRTPPMALHEQTDDELKEKLSSGNSVTKRRQWPKPY